MVMASFLDSYGINNVHTHTHSHTQSLLFLFLLPVRGPKPKAHKPVEAIAILYVLLHMWAPYLSSFIT